LPMDLHRKKHGIHYTPSDVFREHILPRIRDSLEEYTWIDLYCGEGNLILPLLDDIKDDRERNRFFEDHVRGFDIDSTALDTFSSRLRELGIDETLLERNIREADTLAGFPDFETQFPPYHITNPPYLYKGFMPKTEKTRELLAYFKGKKEPLQDLYQLALYNDRESPLKNMIYIIPTNFLYADAASNYVRRLLYRNFFLKDCVIFEKKIFTDTDYNVCICFFERKPLPDERPLTVKAIKITGDGQRERTYLLKKEYNWRAGIEFDEFVRRHKARRPLRVSLYLMSKDVDAQAGREEVELIDVNRLEGKGYGKVVAHVNETLYQRIKRNPLYLRTLDTGKPDRKAGFYDVKEEYNADGLLVSLPHTYRTHPIQIFFDDDLSETDVRFVQLWSNCILNLLREEFDNDFLTTYRESSNYYTRKYFGLNQARKIISTCPINDLRDEKSSLHYQDVAKSPSNMESFVEEYLATDRDGDRRVSQEQHTLNVEY